MYSEISSKIQTLAEGIDGIKEIFNRPLDKGESPTKYPALIYFPSPDGFVNSYETTNENALYINYKIYLMVSVNGTTIENIYSTVMPNLLEELRNTFNNNWNLRNVGGHSIRSLLSNGGWETDKTNNGIEVISDNTLTIKTLTNNN